MTMNIDRRSWLWLAVGMVAVVGLTAPAMAENPTKLNIAVILSAGIENSWDGTMIRSLERVKAEKPHGLELSWKYTDPLWGDEAGDAMRLFAESGDYDIIWAHSTYSDQVKKLKDEFPEILFVVVGSGNEPLGGNQYWIYKRTHEPAYLMGLMAGRMTKSNKIGAIGTYPADDVNDSINAFFAGAKSVNPNIKQTAVFIESWYDPAKAGEYLNAQVSTGVDMVYQLAGNFEPCVQHKIMCFGNFDDQNSYAPDNILSSTVAVWDSDIKRIIDAWWAHKTEGTAYAGDTSVTYLTMAQGGSALAPYHNVESQVPQAVKDEVEATKAKIISGELKVPLLVDTPTSDQ
jgi:basic membrane protein A